MKRRPSKEDLRAVAAYARVLAAARPPGGQWHGIKDGRPWFEPEAEIAAFVGEVYARGIIVKNLDWPSWTAGERIERDPARLERADLLTVRKLITAHVRSDNFCDGSLAGAVATGTLLRILERLGELADR